MLQEWLSEHRQTETNYWWFVNKRRLVRQLLGRFQPEGRTLLEVGCGGGLFSSELSHGGWRVVSSDLSPIAARYARSQGVPETLAFNAGRGWPLADGSMDAFIMLDVLEHVEHDGACLAEARRVLRSGGIGIVSVPTYQFLFSPWDEYNGHCRRYTLGSLRRRAVEAGLRVEWQSYWNAVSVPPAIVLRLKDKLIGAKLQNVTFPRVSEVVNRSLIAYGGIECQWLNRFRLPFGLSAMIVVRNPEKQQ
jgi:SAM-dependent methyltransferase